MKSSIAASVMLSASLASGCAVTVDSQTEIVREEKRFTVSGLADVRVTTFDGSIQIRAWDKPEVLVEIEKRGPTRESLDALEVKTSQSGNIVELEVKRPRTESYRGFVHRSANARLIVSVPRASNVRAHSGDGSIRIEHVNGNMELRTGDGSVVVENSEGPLDIETGDGSINVSGKLMSVKLHTGDGSVVLRADPGTTMASNWDINTGDGSVSVYLPDDFSAELDAHTGDGTVRSDLNSLEGPSGGSSRRTLRGRIGAGGKLFRIRTGDGSIKLRAR